MKVKQVILLVFIALALVIFVDYVASGKTLSSPVVEVIQKRQGADGRRYHYSYRVQTENQSFLVPKDFAELLKPNDVVQFNVSPIFHQVNAFKDLKTGTTGQYSLRLFSGFLVPISCLLVFYLGWKYPKKMYVLTFVLQVVLLADLALLLTQ